MMIRKRNEIYVTPVWLFSLNVLQIVFNFYLPSYLVWISEVAFKPLEFHTVQEIVGMYVDLCRTNMFVFCGHAIFVVSNGIELPRAKVMYVIFF
jgi:hypothetical protein